MDNHNSLVYELEAGNTIILACFKDWTLKRTKKKKKMKVQGFKARLRGFLWGGGWLGKLLYMNLWKLEIFTTKYSTVLITFQINLYNFHILKTGLWRIQYVLDVQLVYVHIYKHQHRSVQSLKPLGSTDESEQQLLRVSGNTTLHTFM